MTVVYRVRKNKKEAKAILLRFWTADLSIEVDTGLIITDLDQWDEDAGRFNLANCPPDWIHVQLVLAKVELRIYEEYLASNRDKNTIDKNWLKRIILTTFNRPQKEISKFM